VIEWGIIAMASEFKTAADFSRKSMLEVDGSISGSGAYCHALPQPDQPIFPTNSCAAIARGRGA
jgi:hypothetical protein